MAKARAETKFDLTGYDEDGDDVTQMNGVPFGELEAVVLDMLAENDEVTSVEATAIFTREEFE